MKLGFGGQEFVLHPSGLVFWPAQGLAIVADLHLEKGSHFAQRGYFVPPYDTRETLLRLASVLAQLKPNRLLVLGDTFHDAKGFARLLPADRALFDALGAFAPIWVIGNHDGDFVPPGFTGHSEFVLEGITFRHQAGAGGDFEVSGHFHPKAEMTHKGARLSRRAFVHDHRRLVLPAFGSYAGGLSVTDPAIAGLFPQGYQLHVLGTSRVFTVGRGADQPRERERK